MGKSKNKKVIVLIVGLLLIIFGLMGYLIYDKVIVSNNGVDAQGKQTKKKSMVDEKEEVEEVLTKDERDEISTKVSQILFKGVLSTIEEYVPNEDEEFSSYNFYSDSLLESRVSDEYKALVALNMTKGNRVSIDQEQKSAEEVHKIYKNYFGTEWKDVKLDAIVTCPTYTYDATNNVYSAYQACGGTAANTIILHKDNYELINGVASVDVYVATYVPSDTDMNSGVISSELNPDYQNLDRSKIIAQVNSESERRITDNNKDKINSYKFSFKRGEDGNFYFNSLKNNN